jgi:hypothetical protein
MKQGVAGTRAQRVVDHRHQGADVSAQLRVPGTHAPNVARLRQTKHSIGRTAPDIVSELLVGDYELLEPRPPFAKNLSAGEEEWPVAGSASVESAVDHRLEDDDVVAELVDVRVRIHGRLCTLPGSRNIGRLA